MMVTPRKYHPDAMAIEYSTRYKPLTGSPLLTPDVQSPFTIIWSQERYWTRKVEHAIAIRKRENARPYGARRMARLHLINCIRHVKYWRWQHDNCVQKVSEGQDNYKPAEHGNVRMAPCSRGRTRLIWDTNPPTT